jgi:hypothetical protein
MPVHDWMRVDAGIFHAFQLHWIAAIDSVLNDGLLPPDYYSLPEQVAGLGNPDVLALQLTQPNSTPEPTANGSHAPSISGGVTVATLPPKTRFTDRTDDASVARKTRSVVIRHISGHRIVALIEIVSPNNKSSKSEIESLVKKAVEFLRSGIHLMILDLFPPGPRDPQGIHPLIWSELKTTDFQLPSDKPLTLAAYSAGPIKRAFVEPVAVGDSLPNLPLFLTPEIYVPVPLDVTYSAAWGKVPRPWREVLEQPVSGS